MTDIERLAVMVEGLELVCGECDGRKWFVFVEPKGKTQALTYICTRCGEICLASDGD